MEVLKTLNLGLRFVLELCLLAALFIGGANLFNNQVVKWVAAIGMPIMAAGTWGIFIAPKSQNLLIQPYRLMVELLLFGFASFLLYKLGHLKLAIVLITIVVINEILLMLWKQ